MRATRRLVAAALVATLAAGVAACGGDDEVDAGDGSPAGAVEADRPVDADGDGPVAGIDEPVELPFGLAAVEGTEAIGRPAVFDTVESDASTGAPEPVRTLCAAYLVTSGDAPAVLRAWVAQLDGLAVGEVLVSPGEGGAQWMTAMSPDPSEPGARDSDVGRLELWATSDGPVLLVTLSRNDEAPPTPPTVIDEAGSPPEPAPRDLGPAGREAGDVLLSEQGDDLHVPEGARTLMPTIPTMAGTGGSTSVLAAEDGGLAIRALLDEAVGMAPDSDVEEPEVTVLDGVEVVRAGFSIPAGGWSFNVLSVRGPRDPTATLYVTSSAD